MDKKLKEVDIEGTVFLFDLNNIALVEKENQRNVIYFGHMSDRGTHYEFDYSRLNKNRWFYQTKPKHPDPPTRVKIPRIASIDPEGMCQKYGCSLTDLAEKTDFEIMVNQDVYNRRINGQPVTIELCDETYEIDCSSNRLVPVDGSCSDIDLSHFDEYYYDDEKEVYHLFYNLDERTAVDVMGSEKYRGADNQVVVEVPALWHLDPVGSNIANGYIPQSWLMYEDELKLNYVAKQLTALETGHSIRDDINILIPDADGRFPVVSDPYDLRVNRGMLPVLDIAGDIFIVDVQKGIMRSRDSESGRIAFNDIAKYFDEDKGVYIIPYNPTTHEFQESDYINITETPKDLIAVEIPSQKDLDVLAWHDKEGKILGREELIGDLVLQFTAKVIPWKETFLSQVIERNILLSTNVQKYLSGKPQIIQKKSNKKSSRVRRL
ncbi:MAG: hypothetical protein BGO31_12615 [Bacteroidetes bacterium 43-16]|nr:MAG: hypothetical protein BGO31_12615 [Bacteroidetes bacterium 43-16]